MEYGIEENTENSIIIIVLLEDVLLEGFSSKSTNKSGSCFFIYPEKAEKQSNWSAFDVDCLSEERDITFDIGYIKQAECFQSVDRRRDCYRK